MSSAVWILWASLGETNEPQRLFIYGWLAGVICSLLIFIPLKLLTKITEPNRVRAKVAAGRNAAESIKTRLKDECDSNTSHAELTEEDDTISQSSDDESLPHCKMILLVRIDLGMTKGKVAAQCCHAALAAYLIAKSKNSQTREWLKAWERLGQAKITLKCPDEATMLDMQKKARSIGLPAKSICDAGHTQIAAGSRTVLAIGPGPVDLVDQVSGEFKLY
ncbi:hypothetical protein BDV3_001069 [Batrachochytrium dendrobatidis]